MSEDNQWKNKFQELMQVCQGELKKTAELGKRMITAGQSNAELSDSYEDLGRLVFKSIDNGDLSWENENAQVLISKIKEITVNLESLEKEVQDIKKD